MIRALDGKLKMTDCERLKCSWWQKGKPKGPQSAEVIKKRTALMIGKKRSDQSRARQSIVTQKRFANGFVVHNKGKTKDTYHPLTAVSEKMIGNKNQVGRFGPLNGMYGKKAPWLHAYRKAHAGELLSEDHKKKIGEKSRQYWADPTSRSSF